MSDCDPRCKHDRVSYSASKNINLRAYGMTVCDDARADAARYAREYRARRKAAGSIIAHRLSASIDQRIKALPAGPQS